MNLPERFIQHLKQFSFIQKNEVLLVAVSGGVDSIVLCDLLYVAGYHFVIAHCNFQLRGAESERDQQFVRSLGEKYGKRVLVKSFDTNQYAAEHKVSIQVAARELRYNWFNGIVSGEYSIANKEEAKTADDTNEGSHNTPHSRLATHNSPLTTPHSQLTTQNSPAHILTAHHANDNVETMLMNFFKGTGISGLHGILPLQGKIFRPLLFAKKDELLSYAHKKQLSFVEDTSNTSDKYTRNYFRHHLLPVLKEVYPTVEDNLTGNIQRFTEVEELYTQSVQLHKKKLMEVRGNEVHIPVLKLKKTIPLSTVVYEIIKDFGFTSGQLPDVLKLTDSETGRYVSSSAYRIIKNRSWLVISPIRTAAANHILIEETDKNIPFGEGELSIEKIESASFQIPSASNIAAVDLSEITFPILLRKWKQGDYFYPLGMRKKKKLSKFFIDQKLSKTAKENVWVIEADKKIIWVVGHRIDDRFKIKTGTKQILKIKFD